MAGSRHAVRAIWTAIIGRIAPCARRGESAQVEELGWTVGIMNRSDLVRTVEALTRSGVVALELIIKLPRLSILQVQRTVKSPSTLQLCHASFPVGEGIGEAPGETTPNIEAGIPTITSRVGAV